MENSTIAKRFEAAAEEFAEAQNKSLRAKNELKAITSVIFLKMAGTVKERECQVDIDEIVVAKELGYVNAQCEENLAKAKKESMSILFEEWRTARSDRRAEMNLR